jgi:hypothetical protein
MYLHTAPDHFCHHSLISPMPATLFTILLIKAQLYQIGGRGRIAVQDLAQKGT